MSIDTSEIPITSMERRESLHSSKDSSRTKNHISEFMIDTFLHIFVNSFKK
jgi:hypothetical protein